MTVRWGMGTRAWLCTGMVRLSSHGSTGLISSFSAAERWSPSRAAARAAVLVAVCSASYAAASASLLDFAPMDVCSARPIDEG